MMMMKMQRNKKVNGREIIEATEKKEEKKERETIERRNLRVAVGYSSSSSSARGIPDRKVYRILMRLFLGSCRIVVLFSLFICVNVRSW